MAEKDTLSAARERPQDKGEDTRGRPQDNDWALTQGQKAQYTAKLWFAPIPKVVLVAAEKTLKQVQAT